MAGAHFSGQHEKGDPVLMLTHKHGLWTKVQQQPRAPHAHEALRSDDAFRWNQQLLIIKRGPLKHQTTETLETDSKPGRRIEQSCSGMPGVTDDQSVKL